MSATAEKIEYTNPLGYPELTVDTFTPIDNRILIQWDEAHERIEYGSLKGTKALVRPEPERGRHYTGTILVLNRKFVSDELQVGQRVIFEQFCGFEKFFDPAYGRLALVKEPYILAIIPKRVNIEVGEEDFNYDL